MADANQNGLCDADEGCTYPMAINYNSSASFDNGSCQFAMISDCPADIDGSGHVDVVDLLLFLPQFDGIVSRPFRLWLNLLHAARPS